MARPKRISSPREARKIAAAGGKWKVLNTRGFLATIIQTVSAHSRSRYNVRSIRRRSMCLRYGAAQPLQSNLFRSFPASRYRTVAERVMDVGASFLRGTYETRGSAVKVECFGCRTLYTPLPFSPVPPRRPSSPTALASFGSRFSITRTNLPSTRGAPCPFELVTRAEGVTARELTKASSP